MRSERDWGSGDWHFRRFSGAFLAVFWCFSGGLLAVFWRFSVASGGRPISSPPDPDQKNGAFLGFTGRAERFSLAWIAIAFTPRAPAPPSRLPSPTRRPPWPSRPPSRCAGPSPGRPNPPPPRRADPRPTRRGPSGLARIGRSRGPSAGACPRRQRESPSTGRRRRSPDAGWPPTGREAAGDRVRRRRFRRRIPPPAQAAATRRGASVVSPRRSRSAAADHPGLEKCLPVDSHVVSLS